MLPGSDPASMLRFLHWVVLAAWLAFCIFALLGGSGCSLLRDTGEKVEAFRQLNRGL